ncbi:type II toxin-antitoxin system death-on-curing family toxin [Noviherbaspirillum aerium]|uniref:type II toxin-antitoxin system death-on-curing family toxin n=1 Tax=Noviherbaspirillum aerium TaxID=2588497 RepID=UPI00124E08CA|nr:type II toxin-antitoxin system death-on-curing family toxin [Noviherbaspirillum aerium]
MIESLILAEKVIEIHDLILSTEEGLSGDYGPGRLEGALGRVTNKVVYEGMEDVFDIAAMYAVAIGRGHVFVDANKRTALVTALAYLSIQGIDIDRDEKLEDMMVDVAEGTLEHHEFSELLYSIYAGQVGEDFDTLEEDGANEQSE